MVAGYHLIFSAYGCWLANDPRGSSSHEVRNQEFLQLGDLHYGSKKIQPAPSFIREFYLEAEKLLKYERLHFDDKAIEIIGQSFRQTVLERRYTCYGCAIMWDHVHLLIRKHRDLAETMIDHFQQMSRAALIANGLREQEHPVWGGPGWKVFLNTREEMERVEKYIRENPERAGKPAQYWDFVQVYDGWLPGVGRKR